MESWKILGAILFPNLPGYINGRITKNNLTPWYESLKKPSFNPPNWIFAPVWITLYSGMGYASYLVWRDGGGFNGIGKSALSLYGLQLGLNWSWTSIFFHFHQLKWSFYECSLLTVVAAACGFEFYKINRLAGFIFVPYVTWLAYASILNYTIYKKNPGQVPLDNNRKEN